MMILTRVILVSAVLCMAAAICPSQKQTRSPQRCNQAGADIKEARNLFGPSGEPDKLYERGGARFEYFVKDDVGLVFSNPITLFDNTRPGFSFVDGAQRIDLMLFRTFAGKKPPLDSMPFIFESRSACLLLTSTTNLELIADGEIISELKANLAHRLQNTVTWEDSFADVPFAQLEKFTGARLSAEIHYGDIVYRLSPDELASLRSFVQAIREAAK